MKVLIAQISDCHVTAPGTMFADRVDSGARLADAIRTINALDRQPDLVVGTGDLVDLGSADEYDRLCEVLQDLAAPFLPIAGNHDDRSELRRRYPATLPSGAASDPLDFVVDDLAVRLVVIDTTIPGRHDGRLDDAQLRWLDDRLDEAPERPTIIVQHHPPFPSGIGWMDAANALAGADEEAAVVAEHPQVLALICGHYHRSISRSFGTTTAIVCPSTAAQLALDLGGDVVRYTDEPGAFVLHDWNDATGLSSHLVPVGDHERWTPAWVHASTP